MIVCLLAACVIKADNGTMSGLNAKQFHKYWKIESESPDYKVSFQGDTVEILSPKGLTMWRKEKMSGKVTIEYDACVVVESDKDRLSDLNCFWMASDPQSPDNLWKREKWRSGIFLNCYSLQLYYLGYGGNHNSTTRFRRYDGNEEGITQKEARPAILKEYTDEAHLLKPNKWYHIKITNENNRVCYYIDGERLVDFRDASPLTEGWFGFRTTLSRTRITNFKYECSPLNTADIPLQWIGTTPAKDKPVSWGVPFGEGVLKADALLKLTTDKGQEVTIDSWPLAYWPDGSVKWCAVSGIIPGNTDKLILNQKTKKEAKSQAKRIDWVHEEGNNIRVDAGDVQAYLSKEGEFLMDSLSYQGVKVGEKLRLFCQTQSEPALEKVATIAFSNYSSQLKKVQIEREGQVRTTLKLEGVHVNEQGREWLPFVVRLYIYKGSGEIKMVHSFVYDGDQDKDFIRALGVRMDVPLRESLYNRHVAFSCEEGGTWSEPVQPLVGRRVLTLGKPQPGEPSLQQQQMEGKRIPDYDEFDQKNRALLDNWASWDGYRLSQLSADSYSIRKRANDNNPWIGTFSGNRSNGYMFVGDVTGGIGVCMHDFWQSYPSSLEVSGAKTSVATITAWL